MNQPACAKDVFQALETVLDLGWAGGAAGAERILWPLAEAGVPLYGRLNWVHAPRLQICGPEESNFFGRLEPVVREALIRNLLEFPTGAVLVCGGVEPIEALRAGAEVAGVPLWSSPAPPEVV
ncbi:MAG: hypothetical protein WBQ37_12650, partial [Candidatus Competibacter sp.]